MPSLPVSLTAILPLSLVLRSRTQRFDIQSVKSAQLDFTSQFSLTASRDDSLDAFVVWFDTPFELKCKKRINLSTSPMVSRCSGASCSVPCPDQCASV